MPWLTIPLSKKNDIAGGGGNVSPRPGKGERGGRSASKERSKLK